MPNYVKIANKPDISEGCGQCIEIQGKRIALFRVDDEFHAIDDMCTHDDAPLSEGPIEGDEVVCPWHAATFNLKTGKCTGPPADADVTTYPVRVVGNDIEIEL